MTETQNSRSIDALTCDQAKEVVRARALEAKRAGNVAMILGSNGRPGRSATGNYSLLAKATGLSRPHVSRVLKGKVAPSVETLRSIAEVCELSLDAVSGWIEAQKQKRVEREAA